MLGPARFGTGGIDRVAHGPRRRGEFLDRARRRLVDQLQGGDTPHVDDIGLDATVDLRRLAEPAPDDIDVRMRQLPGHQGMPERLVPQGRRRVVGLFYCGTLGALRCGIRRLEQRLADFDNPHGFTARDTGDLLHHLDGGAEPAGLRQAGMTEVPRRAPGDHPRQHHFELLDFS